jgi:hypothetical protein
MSTSANLPHVSLEEVGSRPLTAEEQKHLAECPPCREEMETREALQKVVHASPPPDISQLIHDQVRVELQQQPKPKSWERTWTIAVLLALCGALPALAMSIRTDWDGLTFAQRLLSLGVPAVAFFAASLAAFWPGLRLRSVLPVVVVVTSMGVLLLCPGERHEVHSPGMVCLPMVVGMSALPLLLMLVLLRREELSKGRGLLAALAAGGLGELMLFRHCPCSSPRHILTTHLLGWLVVAGLGMLLGAWLRSPVWRPKEQRP